MVFGNEIGSIFENGKQMFHNGNQIQVYMVYIPTFRPTNLP